MYSTDCPACGSPNPDDARFCGDCGEAFTTERPCPACGRDVPAEKKFCHWCGQRLGVPPADTAPPATPPPADPPSARPMPLSVGGGRYHIRTFLGEGARKQVYLAHDTRLARDVALAVIKTEGFDAKARQRVQREAQAMGRLGDHPHIVTVHDIGEDGDQLYIVSEYMAGGDLAGHLPEAPDGRLPMEEALRIGEQVCSALEHAHGRDIIHRDLKPGNVWLAEGPGTGAGGSAIQARLGDFGLAVDLERSRITQEGVMLGTVAYMPPEQALGRPADARSDLYALGAMLYEMVTGRTPFQGDDAVAIITQHINTPAVRPSWHNPHVSPSLDALIMHLLEKTPADRPASAAEVHRRLQQIAAESGEAGVPASVEAAAQTPGPNRMAWGRYVGRAEELDRLKAGVEEALSGRGHLVMVVGEPGIGKTRTAQEIATYAQVRGAQVLIGRCYEGEGAPAYWPWVQIVRAHVTEADPRVLRSDMGPGAVDIAQVVSDVGAALPDLPPPPKLEPDQERFRLFDSVTAFLKNLSRREPLLLVLDDLHWADKSSLLLLQFLARELRGTRIVVLGTYRDVELERKHPLSEMLTALRTERLYHRVLLRGLSPEEVTGMLAAISRQQTDDAQRALGEAIWRETEGNPFFVEEIVLHLAESGAIYRNADGEWVGRGTSIADLGIPEGVREVIGRRLSRLSDAANVVLGIGAVIGRDFDLAAVERVSDLDADALRAALEEATRAGIIAEQQEPRGQYRFSHALLKETLYEELSTPQRIRYHRAVGDAIEALRADSIETHLPELAHHFTEGARAGGDLAKAVDYAVRAAERANAQLAYEEAAAHYDRALQALELHDPVDQRRLAELLLALGTALSDAGENETSDAALVRCTDVARAVGAPEFFAEAALRYRFHHIEYGAVDPRTYALCEEALTLLPDGDSPARARLLTEQIYRLSWQDRVGAWSSHDALPLMNEAVAMAERTGDPEATANALHPLFFLQASPINDRRAAGERMAGLGREAGLPHWEARGTFLLAHLAIETGDVATAREKLQECRRIAEECRAAPVRWNALLLECALAQVAGDLGGTERLAAEALALGRGVMEANAIQYFGGMMLAVRWYQGRLPELREVVAPDLERYGGTPIYRAMFATIELACGNADAARAEFERFAAQDFADLSLDDIAIGGVLALLAELAVHFGDRNRAARLYELLRPMAPSVLTVGMNDGAYGPAAHWLGTLAALRERWDEAERHFQAAVALSEQMESPLFLARAQAEYANMLMARGRPQDRGTAFTLANSAAGAAEELGLQPTLETALAIKLELQGVSAESDRHASIDLVAATVQMEQPDLKPHASPEGTVTILFSDIEGFTEMTERLGDFTMQDVLRDHNTIVREQVHAHGGYEVKAEGDGFMLAFGSARKAIDCAVAMQRAFAAYNAQNGGDPAAGRATGAEAGAGLGGDKLAPEAGQPVAPAVQRRPPESGDPISPGPGRADLKVRMGLHTGEVIKEADDFFGKNVILAARIAGQADGGEILVSSLVKDLTANAGDLTFADARRAELTGLAGTFSLHPVAWA